MLQVQHSHCDWLGREHAQGLGFIHMGLGLSFKCVCTAGEREGRSVSNLLLYCSAQQTFEHFSSVLPEETCLWAEQTLWGWGLAVY